MIRGVRIAGYRSIRSLSLEFAPLTVVLGANGAGKTNLYRAMALIRAAVTGRLAAEIAAEGGMPSALWAGQGWRFEAERETAARGRGRGPVRIELEAELDDAALGGSYRLEIGLPGPTDPALPLDPVVRREALRCRLGSRSVLMVEREGPRVSARDTDGRLDVIESDLLMSETAVGRPGEAVAHPMVLRLLRRIGGWAFHHQFRTDAQSPLRQPAVAVTAPRLASAGGEDWAAVLYTRLVLEAGPDVERSPITEALRAAFPGGTLEFAVEGARLEPMLLVPEFPRPFSAFELSDGTLRYLCLIAALQGLRPAPFVALNEPEASLNADLIPPLAHLIGGAAGRTQVLVVTHSAALAEILDIDYAAEVVRLEKRRGETVLA